MPVGPRTHRGCPAAQPGPGPEVPAVEFWGDRDQRRVVSCRVRQFSQQLRLKPSSVALPGWHPTENHPGSSSTVPESAWVGHKQIFKRLNQAERWNKWVNWLTKWNKVVQNSWGQHANLMASTMTSTNSSLGMAYPFFSSFSTTAPCTARPESWKAMCQINNCFILIHRLCLDKKLYFQFRVFFHCNFNFNRFNSTLRHKQTSQQILSSSKHSHLLLIRYLHTLLQIQDLEMDETPNF